MLNDPTTVEDESRVGSPDESNEDTRRFKVMPDTSQDKQEVIDKCLNTGHSSFLSLLGDNPEIVFQTQLAIYLPRFSDKATNKYTIQQAESCINFVINLNKMLEGRVDLMDLGDINDLFLGDDQ